MTWSVIRLVVRANTSDGVIDRLYANGNMQVPIDVAITAVDANEKPYYLSDQELSTIKLVDYNNVDRPLSGKWKYTDQENEFGHIMDGAGGFVGSSSDSAGANSHSSGHSSVQTKRYWVSTTGIENQKIGAAITEPNGNYYNTHSKDEDNFVTLTGISPIVYNTSNVRIHHDDNDTTTGSYTTHLELRVQFVEQKINTELGWKAQNYQLSMDRAMVKKAEIYGYHTSSDSLNYSIKYQPIAGGELNIFYMWPLGSQQDRQTGLYLDAPIGTGRFVGNVVATVPTNNRRGSLCFTRVRFMGASVHLIPWGPEKTEKAGCKVYDEWGNWGQFKISFSGTGKDQNVALVDTN